MSTLTQTLKLVKLKGKVCPVVREQYLRDDISCHSPLCQSCTREEKGPKASGLNQDAIHYIIPCIDIIENYLEVLELQDLKGIIILQSIASKILQTHGNRAFNRLLSICKDVRRGSVVFLNEICKNSNVPRNGSDSFDTWLIKCSVSAARFYFEHLGGAVPIILITENVQLFKPLVKDIAVQVYSLKEYLDTFYKGASSLLQLLESLNLALSAGTVKDLSRSYDSYLPSDILQAGIKSGRFARGHLRVNKHNASEEAFVTSSKTFVKDAGDIFVHGMVHRNRAIHGDEVVVELLPKEHWKSRNFNLVDDAYNSKENGNEDSQSSASQALPTGKVVGILERCWRNYVATLPEEEEDSVSTTRNKERILVIPYDYRIPKIRVVTKQAESLRNKRIVVRIDNWEKESQYPNGHLVQTLGEIGELETEIQTLLIEHGIFVGEFPKNLTSELPVCSAENPWKIEKEEILKRKDLRDTHLIFSIDPKGCEDVDDALSVRVLPNGFLELGVHIADVTHFVHDSSLIDLEARCRSTSVYLPDRRYDMLPHLLSGNLCSLLGNLDRYAVSILWELDFNYKVQNVWYGRTIINSSYKLCYEAAQEILFGAQVKDVILEIPEFQGLCDSDLSVRFCELKDSLFKLYHIANAIRQDRLSAGGLELNSINMKFEIDRSLPAVVTDIKSSKELAIHKTVAECMIFANHWVAKKILESFPNQAVLRRHPNPREVDLAELQKLATSKGFTLNINSNKELAMSLEKAVDVCDPFVNQIIRLLATQAMNQATYCCTGCFNLPDLYHYGLGLDKYTHFTSPIRRYADILVHRLLLAAVENKNTDIKKDSSEVELMCHHMNTKHRAAQDLEKDSQQLFLAFYFEEMESQKKSSMCVVDAVIYALRTNGLLVFIPKYGMKGAVCLHNKDKKVAIVRKGAVTWVDGKIINKEPCLTVQASGVSQAYSIFDHVTVCIKAQKSRSHQYRILLDLVDNQALPSNKTKFLQDMSDIQLLPTESKVEMENKNLEELPAQKDKEFNLYLFLEKIRDLTISEPHGDVNVF